MQSITFSSVCSHSSIGITLHYYFPSKPDILLFIFQRENIACYKCCLNVTYIRYIYISDFLHAADACSLCILYIRNSTYICQFCLQEGTLTYDCMHVYSMRHLSVGDGLETVLCHRIWIWQSWDLHRLELPSAIPMNTAKVDLATHMVSVANGAKADTNNMQKAPTSLCKPALTCQYSHLTRANKLYRTDGKCTSRWVLHRARHGRQGRH